MIFISYKSEEYEVASTIRGLLESHNYPCWMAPESISAGSNYMHEIPTAIRTCDLFVLIISEASQKSQWVQKEIDRAVKFNRYIVPFHIDNSELIDAIDFVISNNQRIEASTNFQQACEELLQVVRIRHPAVNAPDPTIAPAPGLEPPTPIKHEVTPPIPQEEQIFTPELSQEKLLQLLGKLYPASIEKLIPGYEAFKAAEATSTIPQPVEPEPIEPEPVEPEPVEPEPIEPEPIEPEPVEPEPVEPEPVEPEPVEPEPIEPEPVEPEPVEPEPVEPEPVEPEPVEPEPVEPEPVEPEPIEPEPIEPEPVEPEPVEPKPIEIKTVQPKIVEVNTVQPKIVEVNTVQPKIVEVNTVQPKIVEINSAQPKIVEINSAQPKPITTQPEQAAEAPQDIQYYARQAILQDMNKTYEKRYAQANPKGFKILLNKLIGYKAHKKEAGNVVIPCGVEVIGASVFAKQKSVRCVILPPTVKTIEANAFEDCVNLVRVVFHEGLTHIGSNAFRGCLLLNDITLPKTVRQIDDFAFFDCRSAVFNLHSKLNYIGAAAFNCCKKVIIPADHPTYVIKNNCVINKIEQSIVSTAVDCQIPKIDTLQAIGKYAFAGSLSLGCLTIPAHILYIGEGAFHNCYTIKEVTIEGNLEEIGRQAFAECTELRKVDVKSGISTIASQAFWHCKNLRDVNLAKKTRYIATDAFIGCPYGMH